MHTLMHEHHTSHHERTKTPFIWECLFFFGIYLLLLLVAWPSLHQPFYWDTAHFLVAGAKNILAYKDLFAYFGNTDYPHTFLLPWSTALLLAISGDKAVFVIHFVSILTALGFLVIFYYLLKKFTGLWGGVAGTLLFLTNSLFLAQAGLYYFEIPGTALRFLALLSLLNKKTRWYFLFSVLAFFCRLENGVLFVMVNAIYPFIDPVYKEKKQSWYQYYFAPYVLIVAGWLFVHFLKSGWWFYGPEWGHPNHPLLALQAAAQFLFIQQGRFAVSLGIICLLIILGIQKKLSHFLTHFFQLFVLLSIAFIGTALPIAKLGHLLPRYIFGALSILYIFLILLLVKVVKNKVVFFLLILLMCGTQLWGRGYCNYNYENCVYIYDFLEVKLAASKYMETTYPTLPIMTDEPDVFELRHPEFGYTTKPLQTMALQDQTDLPEKGIIYLLPYSSGPVGDFAYGNDPSYNIALQKEFQKGTVSVKVLSFEKKK